MSCEQCNFIRNFKFIPRKFQQKDLHVWNLILGKSNKLRAKNIKISLQDMACEVHTSKIWASKLDEVHYVKDCGHRLCDKLWNNYERQKVTLFNWNITHIQEKSHLNKMHAYISLLWTMVHVKLSHTNWIQIMIVATLALGLRPRQKGLQGCRPKGSPGVTSGTPGSVGKCEGVNPHTPKATPTLGDGVPVDSRNFRDRFEGWNLNGLWSSLYQWKVLEA